MLKKLRKKRREQEEEKDKELRVERSPPLPVDIPDSLPCRS
jgi:hypothetical protein